MSTEGPWEFIYVLPNLVLPSPREGHVGDGTDGNWSRGLGLPDFSDLVFVPQEDPRVQALVHESASLNRILSSFQTQGGAPYQPSVLIAARSANERVRHDLAALVAFRNAVAFQFLLIARARGVGALNPQEPSWSDTFEFHPTSLSDKGRIVTYGQAVRAIFAEGTNLFLTHSPHLFTCGRQLHPDYYLRRALSGAWNEAFNTSQLTDYHRTLFRSLEMAFLACSLSTGNEGSLGDYGTRLALWVSALEILSWYGRDRADFGSVHELVGRYQWAADWLNRPEYVHRWKNTDVPCTPVQYVYALLYKARNAFLHGDPVSPATLSPPELRDEVGLPQLASLVFRTALVAFLQPRWPRIAPDEFNIEFFEEVSYRQALRQAFKESDEDERR